MKITFTSHAKYRIEKRKILEQEVIDAIKHPDKTIKRHDKYYFQKRLERGTIEVSCEKTERIINIITVYWL
ncbi:DUF4258 domain-containing protein [Candidatus Woesearchaeota archaeon]|nr:DUF4258 domain-containing protein [Candidatus Woesearchaeota archaeon]